MTLDTVSPQTKLNELVATLRDIIFPPVCANCQKVGQLICPECFQRIQWIKEPVCLCCGRLLVPSWGLCDSCQTTPLPLKQIRAATLFAEPVSSIIHKLKYKGSFGLGKILAELMVSVWDQWQVSVDFVVPIPLHPEREKKRGYNQSALLARHFSQQCGYVYAPGLLRRTRFTLPQVSLNAAERAQNVQNAFAVEGHGLVGKSVLLVDDVCTTGATMAAAAQALLDKGALSVSGYCLARAM